MRRSYVIAIIAVVSLAIAGFLLYFVNPPKEQPAQLPGRIQGVTSYPSEEGIPAQMVCAQSVKDPDWIKCVNAPEKFGQTEPTPTFDISVPVGTYWVYAALTDPADLGLTDPGKAYYTQWVLCGMKYECKDHTRIEINIDSDQTVTGILPADWQ